LSLVGLAALVTFALAGSAFARAKARPDRTVSTASLRVAVDHYRTVTWTYERAAREPRTPTAWSDRRSTDPSYLQWTIDAWMQRAYDARADALERIHRSLQVALPHAPKLHASLAARVVFSRRLTMRLRSIYPGVPSTAARSLSSARGVVSQAVLRLWQRRSARAALLVSEHGYARPPVPAYLAQAFSCIHRYEGSWTANTGNGYYGGLQMDVSFQARYGPEYLRRWGTADRWPAWAQVVAASRAYRSGRGFWPWPNTARACGLL
jgi:hypothetical protein